jgi:plasmid maintenance system antidote protein VapI
MSAKEIMKKYTTEEIADAFVLTSNLTSKQKRQAVTELREARARAQSEMSDKDRLTLKLMQLKFKMEDYLEGESFDPKLTFSYFLKEYVGILNKKRKSFAQDIDIDETELSQLINRHRHPNDNIMVRLEIHSNNSISAVTWYRLVEKEKVYALKTNVALRQREKKYVTNKLAVHIG